MLWDFTEGRRVASAKEEDSSKIYVCLTLWVWPLCLEGLVSGLGCVCAEKCDSLFLKLEITDFSRLDGSKSRDSPVSTSSEPGL